MVSSVTSVSHRSSSSVVKFLQSTKPTGTRPSVTVTGKVTTSTTTVLHTVSQSSAFTTITSKEVFSTTLTVDSPSPDSNSISDTQVLQQLTFLPLSSTTLVSSLPVETAESIPFTTLDPTLTTSGMIVSTFVTASTDSLGVHTFTTVTTMTHFQPGDPSSTPEKDSHPSHNSSSPNIPMIILVVLGITVACALTLLFIWWCRGRRREARDNHIYPFSEGVENLAWKQRFGRTFDERPCSAAQHNPQHAINRVNDRSFWNNHGRETTPTPFLEQTGTEVLVIGNPGPSSPHVRFEKMLENSESGSEARTPRRTREGITQRDRPPTYYTNSTGLATIATTLPLYSAIDPSPISERSDTSTTPIASTPKSPFTGRRTQPARFSPRTPFGRKF